MPETPASFSSVEQAASRIAPYVHRTPVLTSRTLNDRCGAELFFKCENFQKIGAFKARGAHNAVFSLSKASQQRGIVTHSSGNHAAAIALAAKNAGTTAYVVMPKNSSRVKIAAVERLGGAITFCEPNTPAREEACQRLASETGATLVHPYDDWNVIAGQGTAALELVQEVPNLQAILTPVGGGGLLGGTSIVGQHFGLEVYGTEPAGADDAYRSIRAGSIQPATVVNTIADGLRTTLGERPFELIQRNIRDIVTVSDPEIIEAMRAVWEILKIIIEPSCAVPLAAVLQKRVEVAGKRVGIILSGGNVDLDALPWVANTATKAT